MATEMKWFRMHNNVVDNDKVRLLAFEDRWHYVALLSLKSAGLLDDAGAHLERRIAVKLGLSVPALDEVKRRLAEVNLIDDNWQPVGWEKHQYISDSSAERTRKYRENKKSRHGDVTVTLSETDSDTESEAEEEKTPPTPSPEQQCVDAYHRLLPMLPAVAKLIDSRRQRLKAQWETHGMALPMSEFWTKVFERAAASDFITGRRQNDRNWRPNIDFFLQARSLVKLLEGQYDNRGGTPERVVPPARLWDESQERFLDTKDLKPWQIEKLMRADQRAADFEQGSANGA